MPSDPVITFEASPSGKGALVHINCDLGCTIFYTVDGEKPTDQSTKYGTTFPVAPGATVKAIARDAANKLSAIACEGFPERGWPKSRLAWAVGGFWALVAILFLAAWCHARSSNGTIFGPGSDTVMGLTTALCVVGCLFLLVTAFFLGETPLILSCLLAELLGCGAGWLLGTYFSPVGSSEAETFQQIGLTVGTLLSGVLLSKFLRVVDIYLDPVKGAYGQVVLLAAYFLTAALFVSVTVYVDRAYGPGLLITAEMPELPEPHELQTKRVILTPDDSICVILSKAPDFAFQSKTDDGSEEMIPVVQLIASTRSGASRINWFVTPGNYSLWTVGGVVILHQQKKVAGKVAKQPPKSDIKNQAPQDDPRLVASETFAGRIVAVSADGSGAFGRSRLWIGSTERFNSAGKPGKPVDTCQALIKEALPNVYPGVNSESDSKRNKNELSTQRH